jgi:5-methylcytosine-specific restriction endonuclease McrA
VPVIQYRTCTDCGIGYRAPGRDTKSLRCLPCRRVHRAAWTRAWADANPEKAHRSKRAWHEANRAYVKSAKHARRALARDETAERFTSLEIFERDNWTCQICGIHLDPEIKFPDNRSASIDHIVPIKAGGLHTKANVQAACMGCNRRKGGRMAH